MYTVLQNKLLIDKIINTVKKERVIKFELQISTEIQIITKVWIGRNPTHARKEQRMGPKHPPLSWLTSRRPRLLHPYPLQPCPPHPGTTYFKVSLINKYLRLSSVRSKALFIFSITTITLSQLIIIPLYHPRPGFPMSLTVLHSRLCTSHLQFSNMKSLPLPHVL